MKEYGIVTSNEIHRDENMYGTFTEETVWNQFYELIGEKYMKKELKILFLISTMLVLGVDVLLFVEKESKKEL